MNIQNPKHSWKDIMNLRLMNSTIILDVDGVLMAHGENEITSEIQSHIQKLKEKNDIFIVSNSFRKNRCNSAGETLGLICAHTPCKKPCTRILHYIHYDHNKPLIVIGDKVLTDGIFAWRIGALFILTKRQISQNDNRLITLTYKIDDLTRIIMQKILLQKY